MSKELGPIEVVCDAPPYPVVRACGRLGFHNPPDVRWCRVNHLAGSPGKGILAWVRGTGKAVCTCGKAIPLLESYTFTFVSGRQSRYFLGQCHACRAIFWDAP